ncbi:unnamed protein product [Diatraea saccharalis]|uniref:Ig-like domain-containing protein n=1 Tax=Diatraea saccharalis TaxID=40085 RepID=A0A9N9QPT9_9NEOP|nr:unnamed protein product [Diatraea saccharalis]
MALTGVKAALEDSSPHSFLYVFTDAGAKDRQLTDKVRNLAVTKQCQIVFIITGTCKGKVDSTYYTLAKATNGHVFKSSKDDVKKVSTDPTMDDLLLAISGDDAKFEVSKPDGKKADTETIVDVPDSKVVKVNVTEPGEYEITAGSKSDTSVLVETDSNLDFYHGFSITKPFSIVGTSILPLPGIKSYLGINVISLDDIKLESVELSDLDDNFIKELPLESLSGKAFYFTESFLPPNGLFKLTINGLHTKTNAKIRRTSSTPIEVQNVEFVTKENKSPTLVIDKGLHIIAEYGQPLVISCNVNAYPAPNITWYDAADNIIGDKVITVELPYNYKNNIEILKVDKNTTYKCEASNSYGKSQQIVMIEAKRKYYFNVSVRPTDMKIEHRKNEKIFCIIDSYPPSTIIWYKQDKQVKVDDNIDIIENGTALYIKQMKPQLNGIYSCKAQNGVNSTALYFKIIIVGVAPKVTITDEDKIQIKYNEPINLECKVTGFPEPKIIWKEINTGDVVSSTTLPSVDKENDYVNILHINHIKKNSTYQCLADNDKGEDSKNIKIEVKIHIDIINKPKDLNIEFKKDGSVKCKVDANPPATLKWYKNGSRLRSDDYLDVTYASDGSSTLMIAEMKPHLVGNYTCKAENEFQSKELKFSIMITGVAPKTSIEGTPKINAEYDKSLKILCKASGYPEPDIVWINNDTGKEFLSTLFPVDPPFDYGHILLIDKVNKNETFICKAKNSLGEHSTNIQVETVKKTFFDILEAPKDTKIKYKENGQAFCKVSANPKADITWYRDGKPLKNNTNIHISSDLSVLSITDMQPELQGRFTCRPKNKNNSTLIHFNLLITGLTLPVIDKSLSFKFLNVLEGSEASIKCLILRGDPVPTVTWRFRPDDETRFTELDENGTEINYEKVSRHRSGVYKCAATNAAGSDYFSIALTVEYAPSIAKTNKKSVTLKQGDKNEILKCEVRGIPKPDVEWLLNDTPIITSEYQVFKDNSISYAVSPDILVITSAAFERAGYYICHASNGRTSANMTYEVIVSAPPKIVETSSILSAEERSSDTSITPMITLTAVKGDLVLRLPCKATGWPIPEIRWTQNDYLIASGTEWYDIADDGTLMIKNVNEGGEYTCTAVNKLGSDVVSYNIILDEAATPETPSRTLSLNNGDTVAVMCDLPHLPVDQLRWYKDGKLLVNGELRLTNVSWLDEGLYTCRVSTLAGSHSSTVDIKVNL